MDEKSKTFCNDRCDYLPLKERDNEEKEKQNRRRNKIIFKLPESKKSELEDRKGEDIKKFIGFGKGIFKINFDLTMIKCIIKLGMQQVKYINCSSEFNQSMISIYSTCTQSGPPYTGAH